MDPRSHSLRPADHGRAHSYTKASFCSPTPSSLADDEGSSSGFSQMDQHRDSNLGSNPPPQYPGEDTRPTTTKELSGWYSYGWAAEVFVICGIGSFIPITLEQLARDQGVLLSDKSKPCSMTLETVAPAKNGTTYDTLTASRPAGDGQCIVNFLGTEINTASFAMYTFSISVFLQALLIISMSGAADHGLYRKSLLLSFALAGSVATMLFIVVVPEIYAFGALLAVVSNISFGASFVLLNSFLPVLVRRHPSLQTALSEDETRDVIHRDHTEAGALPASGEEHPTDLLLKPTATRRSDAPVSQALQLSTKISSYGIGIGYIAAVIVQSLGILIVLIASPLTKSRTLILRVVLLFIGLWWFAFTIPAALWLRPRPGPPLSLASNRKSSWVAYIIYAWSSLFKTIMRARRLKDVVLFLCAWFLLSDSIATVSGTAVLFAKTQLQMKPAALALIALIGTLTGVVGAFTWSKSSRWLGLKPSQTIIACICLFEIIPIYGLLGFVPAIQRLGVFGLQQPWEMYPLGAIYGFVLGGLSSYCRSLFGELIPPGSEAAFYALYAITDKGSSVFGPAIVGAITDRYGEIRPAFVFLAVLIFVPLPLMLFVDVDRGKKEGSEMAKELRREKALGTLSADEDGTVRLLNEEGESMLNDNG
ncbi:Autophagy protein 22 [Lecanora helva]